ncbi:rolling circle replication-associated protein [Salinibacter ruber]|uniref:Replication-associated protein ORF2/G2P domain-containing protein n=1 Tax=Salinibacter ruber TaxID=146919 RepID=A0A9X2V856_9BACT|nr:hypothetical protein [Salinibacter ruber]MCS4123141.1 hypothetical protein [Salinibacter ruber]
MDKNISEGGGVSKTPLFEKDTSEKDRGPASSFLTRPALDEAHIRMRPEGRQLVIDRGSRSEEVNSEDRDRSLAEAMGGETIRDPVAESVISGFSEDSRRRLRGRLHALRRDASGLFLTLTYQHRDPTPDGAKQDLDTFWKRIRRRFPGASAVWKMEPHTEDENRGVPHFHLMVFGVQFIPVQWLSKIWHDVTGERDYAHRKSCVDLEPFVNEDGKLQSYMTEYMEETYDEWPDAEKDGPWAETGRWWGCLSRKQLPYAEWEDAPIYLNESEAIQIISELVDEWDLDLPDGVIPPSLTINTRGDPKAYLDDLMDRL